MKQATVAIIGRPNVGKSTFFNTIAGKRLSIVDDSPGVTRDRVMTSVEWTGVTFTMVDTGGVDFSQEHYQKHIREQVDIAISLADTIVMLVDAKAGLNQNDSEIAQMLRKSKKPLILAVNKADNRNMVDNEFYKLGIKKMHFISCTQKTGLGDLLDDIVATFESSAKEQEPTETKRIALVGRPNAGKSSILNKLVGEKRVMVSDQAGTTRDTIDTPFRFNGRDFILTDTAGIRRKRSIEEQTVEHYSVLRSLAAIRNSDVTVMVIDANEGLTEQDVRLIGYANEQGKPSVICINKWDLIEKDTHTINKFEKQLKIDLAFMSYFKSIYISALTGQRIGEIMKAVDFVLERAQTKITTGVLNTLIGQFVATTPPPFVGNKKAKFSYSTQIGVAPPTFALFVNDPEAVPSSYLRYLENCLRKSVDLTGTPVRMVLRSKGGRN